MEFLNFGLILKRAW